LEAGVNRYKSFLVALSFLLLVLWQIQPAAAQTANSDQTQSLSNDQSFNQQGGVNSITLPSSVPLRTFSIPGENPLPNSLPVPPHFAPPVTDGNYGPLGTILDYKDQYSMGDAEALLEKHGKMRVFTNCFIPENMRVPSPFLRILPAPKDKAAFKKTYEVIGIGNYKSRNANSISEQVLGMAIQEGLKIGADAMLFQEGAALIQTSRGWSIGLFNSLSTTNGGSGAGSGNVNVGGLGFGRGQSSYVSAPWLRVQFFKQVRTAALPARPTYKPGAAKQPSGGKINTYEESLEKPGKEISPEEAFGLHQAAPVTPPPPPRGR
jgi:hypothetical protein